MKKIIIFLIFCFLFIIFSGFRVNSQNPKLYDQISTISTPVNPIIIVPPTSGLLNSDSLVFKIINKNPRVWWNSKKEHLFISSKVFYAFGYRTNDPDSLYCSIDYRYFVSLSDSIKFQSLNFSLKDSIYLPDSLFIDSLPKNFTDLFYFADTIFLIIKTKCFKTDTLTIDTTFPFLKFIVSGG